MTNPGKTFITTAALLYFAMMSLAGLVGCNDNKMPEVGNARIHHDIQQTSKQIDEDLAHDLDLD